MTASEFIRQHPDLAPKALVEAGAAQGLKFTENLVRVVRHNARVGRPRSARRQRSPTRGAAPAQRNAGIESDFMRLVVEIGVGRAKVLIAEVEQRLRAFLLRSG
jgi:hypothetical protein